MPLRSIILMTCLLLRGNFEPFSRKQSHCKQDLNGFELLFMQWQPSLNQTCLQVYLFQVACAGHPIANLCPHALQSNHVHVPM